MRLSRRQYGRLMMLGVAGAMPFLAAACSGPRGAGGSASRPTLSHDVTLSADGRIIAFGAGAKGIGLYDWPTDTVGYIPKPVGFQTLGPASYSPDGRKIVVVAELPRQGGEVIAESKIGIVDVTTQEMTSFPVKERVIANPTIRPDGGAVLYVGGSAMTRRPFLLDLKTRTSRELLSEQDGFYTVFRPSFVSNDTVLFVAMGPKNLELQAKVRALGTSPTSGPVPYLLKFGSKPEFAYLDAINPYLDSLRKGYLPTSISASHSGERVAFIGLSQSEAARQAYKSGDLNRYDLFVIEGKRMRQVTHMETYMAFCSISQDGSTAAFGYFPRPLREVRNFSRGRIPLELAVVDINTGRVTRTNFVKRVYGDELRSKAAAN